MSIQKIVDGASSITIDRHKTTGMSISRSGIVKTSSIMSNQPWQFTVTMNEGMRYSESRALLEEIDLVGRSTESLFNIGTSNTGLAHITAYQGDGFQNGPSLHQCKVINGSGSNLYVNCALVTASVASPTYLFRKGDFVQPGTNYRYPYTVTADVPWSTASNVTIPLHRPFITDVYVNLGTANAGLLVGTGVTWRVKAMKKPTWTLQPWDRVVFDGEFELIEIILDDIP